MTHLRLTSLGLIVFLSAACVAPASVTPTPIHATPSPATPSPVTPSPTPSPVPSPTPGASPVLVLRVDEVGGFIAPSVLLSRLPILAVYADGRVFTVGAQDAIYPGQLMPGLLVAHLTPTGLARLLDAADTIGLSDAVYPPRGVADAPTTVFVIVHNGHRALIYFGALGLGLGTDVPPAEAAARKAAEAFLAQTVDLANLVGATEIGAAVPFVPDAIQIMSWPGDPSANADPALVRKPVAWQLSTPLSIFGMPGGLTSGLPSGARCGVSLGADTAILLPVLTAASSLTGFSSAGVVFTVTPRPLLPDEIHCGAGI